VSAIRYLPNRPSSTRSAVCCQPANDLFLRLASGGVNVGRLQFAELVIHVVAALFPDAGSLEHVSQPSILHEPGDFPRNCTSRAQRCW